MALDYTGRAVGVSVEFDTRDQSIDVLLVPLTEGELPPRDRPGWLFLDRIVALRGQRTAQRDSETLTEEQVNERVSREAQLLREFGSDLLTSSAGTLERLRAELPAT